MIVDLPEGWESDPSNPFADMYASGALVSPLKFGTGQYFELPSHLIDHLIENENPLNPLFFKGTDEERVKNMALHFKEDRPEDCGVCDHPYQVLERWPQLKTDPRPFVILFHRINRADQPSEGGWRWHKWGRYIGTREPQCEYLYDEPEIDHVFTFDIVQIKAG